MEIRNSTMLLLIVGSPAFVNMSMTKDDSFANDANRVVFPLLKQGNKLVKYYKIKGRVEKNELTEQGGPPCPFDISSEEQEAERACAVWTRLVPN
jgi:hypothetical protein